MIMYCHNNVVGISSIASEEGGCSMELVTDGQQIFNGRLVPDGDQIYIGRITYLLHFAISAG